MLWFALALMTGAAMAAIAWPLTRQARSLRSGSDLAVYRDQLEEVRRDQAAGRIGDSEAEAAEVEVSRRLIAAADAEAALQVSTATPGSRRRAVALAALVVVSFGSAGTYLSLGSPTLPGQPLASRDQSQSIDAMIAQVEGHLARNPNDGRGWEVIAPVYLRLGRVEDAIKARRNALALSGETSERQAGLGEALVAASDGKITPEARKSFARAVELDGGNIKARYFLGVAAEQDGQPAAAVEIWRAMLAGAPADAPWRIRNAHRYSMLCTAAQPREATANTKSAPSTMLRRPNASESAPWKSIMNAKANMYAVSVCCTSRGVACNTAWMSGNAGR